MSPRHDESHRWQFELLMLLDEEGREEEREELFQKLLKHHHATLDPLCDFTIEQPNERRVAILLKLLARMGSLKAAPILIRFLDIDVRELRLQAIIGLGWLRARAALDRLDEIQGHTEDDEIRRECQVAIEEILRDFPNLRGRLKNHERVAIKRELIPQESEDQIARQTPVGGAERRRLVGMFPRLLALKYKAVPLGIGPGGVVSVAVPQDLKSDPMEALRTLMGREVDLRGWPLNRIHDRILSFYKWGDEDWIQFGKEQMTDTAREEITEIVLSDIVPEQPHSPLPDCFDSSEAVVSFLSICAEKTWTSAVIEYEGGGGRMDIVLNRAHGETVHLEPPQPNMRTRFFRALTILANCKSIESDDDDSTAEGMIRHPHPQLEEPFQATVRCQKIGGLEVMVLKFVSDEDAERN